MLKIFDGSMYSLGSGESKIVEKLIFLAGISDHTNSYELQTFVGNCFLAALRKKTLDL